MVLSGLMDFLTGISHDPITYSIVFFLYTVAATSSCQYLWRLACS